MRFGKLRAFVFLALLCLGGGIVLSHLSQGTWPLGDGVYSSPIWSPDGGVLAFTFYEGGYDEVWLMKTETSKLRQIHTDFNVRFFGGASWEGLHALWFMGDNGFMSNSIYRLDVSTGETDRIIRSASSWEGFTIHPHRAEIVFAEEKGSGRTHTSELYALDLESQAVVQLTDSPALLETAPLWSPDGEQLAFLFRGMDNIGVMDKNGDVRILEVPTKGGVHSFTWSPDGEWILFLGRYDEPGLYLIPSDGTGTRRLIRSGAFSYVSWSPNGLKIAYTTLGVPGRNELFIVDSSQLGLPGRPD